MKFFDSNFWIAFFDADDSQHDRAKTLFDREQHFSITEYCALETATILDRKGGKDAAGTFLRYIRNNADITIIHSTPKFFEATISLFETAEKKGLSFVDVSLLLLSESHDVITFDKALAQAIESQKK